jgi:hypothetical protein
VAAAVGDEVPVKENATPTAAIAVAATTIVKRLRRTVVTSLAWGS